MPKDSLGIVELGKDSVWKTAGVNGYRTPEKSFGWVAYQLEKDKDVSKTKALSGEAKKIADSLTKIIDSLQALIPKRKIKTRDEENNLQAQRIFWVTGMLNQQLLPFFAKIIFGHIFKCLFLAGLQIH